MTGFTGGLNGRYMALPRRLLGGAAQLAYRDRSWRDLLLPVVGGCAMGTLLFPWAAPGFAAGGVLAALASAVPAMRKHGMSDGIFFLGHDRETGKGLWLTEEDVRRHTLVLGESGPGKTEAMLGLAENALDWSSGFLFCDGKGEVSLYARVYALARMWGREDDLLVLNMMASNRKPGEPYIHSNTLNPFSGLSPEALALMVLSLLDVVGDDRWKGRAEILLTGLARALFWLGERDGTEVDVGTIRDHLNLKSLMRLADAGAYPDMPVEIREGVSRYLESLPGYEADRGFRQPQVTLDQHGYLEMQFYVALAPLADIYGHLFRAGNVDIDMEDVIRGRRIVVVMMPSLERSGGEVARLGRLVMESFKETVSTLLGNGPKGPDLVSRAPFSAMFDEVQGYAAPGAARMASQARALGINLTFGATDMSALKKVGETEANAIFANCDTKIFLRTGDANGNGDTPPVAAPGAGSHGDRSGPVPAGRMATEEELSSGLFVRHNGGLTIRYVGRDEALEEADRINPRDLRLMKPGEMTVLHKHRIFHAAAPQVEDTLSVDRKDLTITVNHLVALRPRKRGEGAAS
jgi:hypothetical protein